MVRHDRFATTANSVVARLEGMAAAVNDHPSLTPLRTLSETLRADLAALTVLFPSRRDDWAGRQVYSDAYLTHQCAVARWLRDRRRVVEAFTVLREAITSCAVRIADAAGVTELAGASST